MPHYSCYVTIICLCQFIPTSYLVDFTIASFSLTTILYGSAQKRFSDTLFPFTINPTNSLQDHSATTLMDINIDTPRGQSTGHKSNNSRESSMLSNASSVAYVNRIQVMANCPTWAEQVDQDPSLSYAMIKGEENNYTNPAPIVEPTHVSHEVAPNNTSTTHGLQPTAIPYAVNQPVDPQLWDSNFCPISIFGMNECLEDDAKNITCSLLRIAAFIRQRELEDKTAEDIPQILEFGFATWDFLLAIYESGWDELAANKNQKSFRQCVSVQFNRKSVNNSVLNKEGKGKQASISRISLPIPLQPSKSILAKSKFFKGN